MSNVCKTPLLIIGSGPAGYSAAIYAARASLSPVLVSGYEQGGQLMLTTSVENYPGFANPIGGPRLMQAMKSQVSNLDCRIIEDQIVGLKISKSPFHLTGESGDEYIAKSIIIATGAQAKWLNIPSERKYLGYGVSSCATCDAPFFKNKLVAVIGGGNTAVEEAIYLTKYAKKVFLIHRRDHLRADKILQDRFVNNKKIIPIWSTILEEIQGSENPKSVKRVVLKNLNSNTRQSIDIDGVFIAIGHTPNTSLFKDQINMDSDGYIVTRPNSTVTSVSGIFASGDVQDKIFRQAITAAGTGCMAALEASSFLAGCC